MLRLHSYVSADDIPPQYECQIRSFLRIQWPDTEEADNNEPLIDPELHPVFFFLARENTLLSYARLIWMNVSHNGQTYKLYGLGDVFTYPASRNKGYGGQVVASATDYIRADPKADTALLLTEPSLHSFYQQSGWQHISDLSISFGDYQNPQSYTGYPMMLFLSKKAQEARRDFQKYPIFLPGDEW